MRRNGVGLLFREDIQVIVVLQGNLWEQKGIWGGSGGGRKGRGRERGSSENGRRRGGGGRGGEGRGGEGGGTVMQEEEQKGEAKVREPRDQSMQGLCRDSHGNPRTTWK